MTIKNTRHFIEYMFLRLLLGICAIVPVTWASASMGWLVSFIAPKMGMNKKVKTHIKAALKLPDDQIDAIAKAHWNNLGRVIAEYPHLKKIATHHVEFRGLEHLERLRDDGIGGVLFGAHLGNWEILPHALLHHVGLPMHPAYRAPNNPYVDKLLHHYRAPNGQITPYAKSRKGMIGMVKALKNGDHLGLLIDQKYNEGIEAPFFGMSAMTGTAFIELSQKYKCPLVPLRCIREKGKFIIEASPPIACDGREVIDVLTDVHHLIEKWIQEYPPQWLWLHRRWKLKDL